MRFNCVMRGLLLVSTVLASAAAVISATRLASPSQTSNEPNSRSTVAQSVETERTKIASTESSGLAWLNNLIGITQFVKNPTQYRVLFEEALGQVTDASLDEDTMTISFRYPTGSEIRTGELTGTVDSNGLFVGVYQTQSSKGVVKGEITLSFVADGTAQGRYDQGAEVTRIFL